MMFLVKTVNFLFSFQGILTDGAQRSVHFLWVVNSLLLSLHLCFLVGGGRLAINRSAVTQFEPASHTL